MLDLLSFRVHCTAHTHSLRTRGIYSALDTRVPSSESTCNVRFNGQFINLCMRKSREKFRSFRKRKSLHLDTRVCARVYAFGLHHNYNDDRDIVVVAFFHFSSLYCRCIWHFPSQCLCPLWFTKSIHHPLNEYKNPVDIFIQVDTSALNKWIDQFICNQGKNIDVYKIVAEKRTI